MGKWSPAKARMVLFLATKPATASWYVWGHRLRTALALERGGLVVAVTFAVGAAYVRLSIAGREVARHLATEEARESDRG